jgi:hypothetical protein
MNFGRLLKFEFNLKIETKFVKHSQWAVSGQQAQVANGRGLLELLAMGAAGCCLGLETSRLHVQIRLGRSSSMGRWPDGPHE